MLNHPFQVYFGINVSDWMGKGISDVMKFEKVHLVFKTKKFSKF